MIIYFSTCYWEFMQNKETSSIGQQLYMTNSCIIKSQNWVQLHHASKNIGYFFMQHYPQICKSIHGYCKSQMEEKHWFRISNYVLANAKSQGPIATLFSLPHPDHFIHSFDLSCHYTAHPNPPAFSITSRMNFVFSLYCTSII